MGGFPGVAPGNPTALVGGGLAFGVRYLSVTLVRTGMFCCPARSARHGLIVLIGLGESIWPSASAWPSRPKHSWARSRRS